MLSGVICKVQPLRYSPAGVPLLQFELQHQSRQSEADKALDVNLTMRVQVAGELAVEVARYSDGSEIVVNGFLARTSQRSDIPVLHVNRYKLLKEANHGIT